MSDQIAQDNDLKSALEERKVAFAQKADPVIKKMYAEGIDAVRNSGIEAQAKKAGDLAPAFSLQNALGNTVSLESYLKKGSVVLTWYRGGWCPYCNITLRFLQNRLAEFNALGANLIALTPELPDHSLSTTEKNELTFEVLSDVGSQVARTYGLVFKLTPDVAQKYQESFDLRSYNGDNGEELPLAATYVINPQGEIIYAFADADYRNRAEPQEMIDALKAQASS